MKPIRFHWSMSSAGEAARGARARAQQRGNPDMAAYLAFCREAEVCGMDTVLTAFGFHRPDPVVLAASLGAQTAKIQFMVAVRSGIFSPTVFVQQINSVAMVNGGRVCLNVVAGHTPDEQKYYGDFLNHGQRYARTDEFLTICRALWRNDGPVNFKGRYYQVENARLNTRFLAQNRTEPEIFVGGASQQAISLAGKHASCLWTLPRAPGELAEKYAALLQTGTELGLLTSILARPSREEALAAARDMLNTVGEDARAVHTQFRKKSDSQVFTSTLRLADEGQHWLTPYLWTGAVPFLGAPSIALLGSYEDVAAGIMEMREAGVSQFLFMGWPDLPEMRRFHRHVVPLVRAAERKKASQLTATVAD